MTKAELKLKAGKARHEDMAIPPELILELLTAIDEGDKRIAVMVDALTVAYQLGQDSMVKSIGADDDLLIL